MITMDDQELDQRKALLVREPLPQLGHAVLLRWWYRTKILKTTVLPARGGFRPRVAC